MEIKLPLNDNIGRTPLVEVDGIYAKLECLNETGSIKARMAHYIIEESERIGLLKPGMTIVEATSGNTGIAFSHLAKKKGYEVILIMPENMNEERKTILRNNGALLELCDKGDFLGAANRRDEIVNSNKNRYFCPDQFANRMNPDVHYLTTGKEILDEIVPDVFIAGVGTGGTFVGVGRAIKEKNPNVHLVAIEPLESAVMTRKCPELNKESEEALAINPGIHGIYGIGDGFIPKIIEENWSMIGEIVTISENDAIRTAHYLSMNHDICIGISSASNYLGAAKFLGVFENIVTVFPDGAHRYESDGLSETGFCPFEYKCRELRSLME